MGGPFSICNLHILIHNGCNDHPQTIPMHPLILHLTLVIIVHSSVLLRWGGKMPGSTSSNESSFNFYGGSRGRMRFLATIYCRSNGIGGSCGLFVVDFWWCISLWLVDWSFEFWRCISLWLVGWSIDFWWCVNILSISWDRYLV